MEWITRHVQELQAISGLVVAVLTIVLLIFNAMYVMANRRTLALMKADLRIKSRPIVRTNLVHLDSWDSTKGQRNHITVSVENAPMRLRAFWIEYHADGKEGPVFKKEFKAVIVSPQRPFELEFVVNFDTQYHAWSLKVFFADLSFFLQYMDLFDENGFLFDSVILDETDPVIRREIRRIRKKHSSGD